MKGCGLAFRVLFNGFSKKGCGLELRLQGLGLEFGCRKRVGSGLGVRGA